MTSPHAPRSASRDLLAAGLALLAATLLTGCDNAGKVVAELAQLFTVLMILWTIFVLVLMAVALVVLIMNTYLLASGRASMAWGTAAFALGLADLSAFNIGSMSVNALPARQDRITIAAFLLGIALVLVGGLSFFLAIRRRSQAAASARLAQEVDAKPAEAEREPPKVS